MVGTVAAIPEYPVLKFGVREIPTLLDVDGQSTIAQHFNLWRETRR